MGLTSKSLVSIVIPTYNQAKFLEEAVASVIKQTHQNFEIIIVDNYSTDTTDEVLKNFCDKRIKILKIRNNGIIASSRNKGIDESRGELIAFLDSDDLWYPKKLATCLASLDEDRGLISHGLRKIGDQGGYIHAGPASKATPDALIDHGNCITPSATIVRKKFLVAVGGFSEHPQLTTSEDYHLWIKLSEYGVKMKFLPEILGDYRIHDGNNSGHICRHLDSVIYLVNNYFENSNQIGRKDYPRRRRRIALAYYGAGRAFHRNKNHRRAIEFFLRGFKIHPFSLHICVGLLISAAIFVLNISKNLRNVMHR